MFEINQYFQQIYKFWVSITEVFDINMYAAFNESHETRIFVISFSDKLRPDFNFSSKIRIIFPLSLTDTLLCPE